MEDYVNSELMNTSENAVDNSDGSFKKQLNRILGFSKESSKAQTNFEVTKDIHSENGQDPVSGGFDKQINDDKEIIEATKTHYSGYVISLTEKNDIVFTKDVKALNMHRRDYIQSETKTQIYNKKVATSSGLMSGNTVYVKTSKILTYPDADDENNDDDEYKFNHEKRGYMIQIVNDDQNRKGADEDLCKMDEIRRKFGFECLNPDQRINVAKQDMIKVLKQAQQADHTNCDCFLFMISCHGASSFPDDDENYGLLFADDQIMYVREIIEMFDDNHCHTLQGKPKLFFIQACRGSLVDDGNTIIVVSENNVHEDGEDDYYQSSGRDKPASKSYNKQDRTNTHLCVNDPMLNNDENMCFLNCENDMVVMFAAPRGMMAWRSESMGSWMIHYLHKNFMDYDFSVPKSLLRVLTKVCQQISRRLTKTKDPDFDQKTIVPVIENKLTKDIYF